MRTQQQIGSIQFAAWKHISAAQNIRQAVALNQKDFQPLCAVAQHDYCGRIARGWQGYVRVQFHGSLVSDEVGRLNYSTVVTPQASRIAAH